jgi:hypothetical protein
MNTGTDEIGEVYAGRSSPIGNLNRDQFRDQSPLIDLHRTSPTKQVQLSKSLKTA